MTRGGSSAALPARNGGGGASTVETRAPASVALFLPHLGFGGVERVNVNLASGLVTRGFDVDIVVAEFIGELRTELPSGVGLVDLGAGRVMYAIPRLAAYLRRAHPSVLVSSKTHANVAADLAIRLSCQRVQHIAWEHGKHQFEEAGGWMDRLVLRLARHIYARLDGIIAVSGDVADWVLKVTNAIPSRVDVIPNPIVTPELHEKLDAPAEDDSLPPSGEVIIGLGRLVREKGFDTLLRAVALLRSRLDVSLVLLGDGEERESLQELVHVLNLQGSVFFAGYVPNPLPYLREASVFALSSRSEGLPLALVEALFAGCEVVATRCSDAVVEVLDDGTYGRLVPVEDPVALAGALEQAIKSPPRPTELRGRANEYSIDRVAERYGALLHGLLSCGSKREDAA